MLQLKTTIDLPASPDRVWAMLTDFNAYPDWNPFITYAAGNWAAGNTVKITAGGMNFRPEVLVFEPGKELRWIGSLLFRGLFDGEHYFRLQDNDDGSTRLTHGEDFSGLLVPLFRNKLNTETLAGFKAMNEALRGRLLDRA